MPQPAHVALSDRRGPEAGGRGPGRVGLCPPWHPSPAVIAGLACLALGGTERSSIKCNNTSSPHSGPRAGIQNKTPQYLIPSFPGLACLALGGTERS